MAPVGEDEPVAAVGAYWSELRQPGPEEVELLQAIADAAALSVANVQLRQHAPAKRRGQRKPTPPASKLGSPRRSAVRPPGPLQAFVGRVRREGLRPNSLGAYAFAVFCVVLATLLREGFRLSGVRHGLVIYSTYYPAAVLAMLVGGRGAGILATALGGVAAYYFFMSPLHTFAPLTLTEALNLTLYGGSCGLIILIIDWYKRTVLRLKEEDAQHLTLAREQHHRVRNSVAVVEAVVQQSLRDLPDRARTINRRIRASLAPINIEGPGAAEATCLGDLLNAELAPYDLARFTLKGEDEARLPPQAGSILALAAHELATNALKHGALSVPGGRVSVAWERADGRANIVWRETGGPRVEPPQRRGYGSIMLRRLIEAAAGTLTVEFRPSGVTAQISLALEPGDERAGRKRAGQPF
jgi:two-component sensor histidine kinase